jgi:hypothetical protein
MMVGAADDGPVSGLAAAHLRREAYSLDQGWVEGALRTG